jgi:hypothetical protein
MMVVGEGYLFEEGIFVEVLMEVEVEVDVDVDVEV